MVLEGHIETRLARSIIREEMRREEIGFEEWVLRFKSNTLIMSSVIMGAGGLFASINIGTNINAKQKLSSFIH